MTKGKKITIYLKRFMKYETPLTVFANITITYIIPSRGRMVDFFYYFYCHVEILVILLQFLFFVVFNESIIGQVISQYE